MKPKLRVGDTVVYRHRSDHYPTKRKEGSIFKIDAIHENNYNKYGRICFPVGENEGEYEIDLRLATKLEKALK